MHSNPSISNLMMTVVAGIVSRISLRVTASTAWLSPTASFPRVLSSSRLFISVAPGLEMKFMWGYRVAGHELHKTAYQAP